MNSILPATIFNEMALRVIGHERALEFLERSLNRSKVTHAYLFVGPKHIGKSAVAEIFALSLLGVKRGFKNYRELAEPFSAFSATNPDLFILDNDSDGKKIGIAEAREFSERLRRSSFLGGRKVGIIKDAQALTAEASNALLKILEEPPPNTHIILCAQNVDALLPTIVSRAEVIRFGFVAQERIQETLVAEGLARESASRLALVSGGLPGLALRLAFDEEFKDEHQSAAAHLRELVSAGVGERIKIVENICGELKGENERKVVERLLFFWEMEARREMLRASGAVLGTEEIDSGFKNNPRGVLSFLAAVQKARGYLDANVQLRLALEHIAFSV